MEEAPRRRDFGHISARYKAAGREEHCKMRAMGAPCLALHLHVPAGLAFLAQVLQQVAALEVLVGVDYRLELGYRHDRFILGLLDFSLVEMLKHPAAAALESAMIVFLMGGSRESEKELFQIASLFGEG